MPAHRWGSFCGFFLAFGLATFASADGVRGISPDGKEGWLHTVDPGDTLWDITETYLGSAWIWPSVWKDNGEIPNPHQISPGDHIWITEREMRRLTPEEVERIRFTDTDAESLPAATDADSQTDGADPSAAEPAPAVYDPFAALDRTSRDLQQVIEFPGLHRMGFLSPTEEQGSAAVLGSHDENYWASQERRTVIGIGEGRVHVGDLFTVFRTRRRVDHPLTGETLGFLIDRLGTAEVTDIHEESSFVRIVSSYSEIEPGDRLIPFEAEPKEFVTVYEGEPREGIVVGMPLHRQYALRGDVIVLDSGSDAGLVVGNEFEIFRAGKEVRDPVTAAKTLVPDDVIGRVVVLKTTSTSSLVLLTEAQRPVSVGDHFRSL